MAAFSQQKKPAKQDTIVTVTVNIDQFRALLYTIDSNIDSKKTSKEILDFLQKSAKLQVADKPKELKEAEKKPD